jgi:hypothetical protein
MTEEDFGRFGKLAPLDAKALCVDLAELIESSLELAGETRAVQSERGKLRD